MRLLILYSLLYLPLFAGFFPNTVQTSVKSVDGEEITMNHSFPVKGMSGVIVHTYKNGQEAITKEVVQTTKSTITPLGDTVVLHDNMPTIQTPVSKGDKVIGGYLYRNVLLLAPNNEVYQKITRKYNKHWIHPDLFITYLARHGDGKATKENLSEFAKTHRVGLVYIVGKESSKLFDPVSGNIVGQKSAEAGLPQSGEFPFFSRLKEISGGLFAEKSGDYYNVMGEF